MQLLNANKIINLLSSDKSTGPDGISVKFIKLSANVIDSHLVNIINKSIDLNCYSENAKIANVRPIFKKSHTCEVGAHLIISVWHLLMNLNDNYSLKKLLKWANRLLIFMLYFFKKIKENTWRYYFTPVYQK